MYTSNVESDLDLYRREARVARSPLVRLSAVDVKPEHYQRTFIFVHGFGGSADQWRYQLQRFLVKDRVVAIDLRGHGLSDKPLEGYDMRQLLADLESALRILDVKGRFILVGHSFGGAIVAEYAVANPKRIDRLILIATAAEFKLRPLFRLALSLPFSLLRLGGPLSRGWLGAPPHVLKMLYVQNMSRWSGWDKFRALTVPTLVIRGHGDRVFDPASFEAVAQAIPTASDVDIGSSGHMVMLERREAVNRAIERFVDGAAGRSWRDRAPSPSAQQAWGEELRRDRPWLNHYEPGVPFTIAVPEIPVHHLLRSSVRRFPLQTALIFESGRLSYRALNREANRFANALQDLGTHKGHRVILLLPNIPQMAIAYFGTLKTGATVVFIPATIAPDEIILEAQQADALVLVTLSTLGQLASRVQAEAGVRHIVLADPADYLRWPISWLMRSPPNRVTSNGARTWHDWLRGRSKKSPDVEIGPADVAVIQYTGGTTGRAKGVMLTHRNLVANALQTRHWMTSAVEGQERFLSVVPIFHSYGLTTGLNVPVALGASIILKARFETLPVLKAIAKHRPTIFAGVPGMYLALSTFPQVRKYGIRSIRACISGSEPLPVEVQEAFEKLTRGHLVEGYGLTEASPVTHANPLQGERRVGSIGLPIPSTEATLFDLVRGNRRVKAGQLGELAVRGPQVMLGYWQDAKGTRAVLRADGWLLTGDVAQQDEAGYFRVVSRKADMWYPSRPGRPAFPRDVEEVIYEIPQVREVAVVAVARRPVAFVIPHGQRPSAASITAYCRRRLPPNLVPHIVIFIDDLPRTFIGKVLRTELAKRYAASLVG